MNNKINDKLETDLYPNEIEGMFYTKEFKEVLTYIRKLDEDSQKNITNYILKLEKENREYQSNELSISKKNYELEIYSKYLEDQIFNLRKKIELKEEGKNPFKKHDKVNIEYIIKERLKGYSYGELSKKFQIPKSTIYYKLRKFEDAIDEYKKEYKYTYDDLSPHLKEEIEERYIRDSVNIVNRNLNEKEKKFKMFLKNGFNSLDELIEALNKNKEL